MVNRGLKERTIRMGQPIKLLLYGSILAVIASVCSHADTGEKNTLEVGEKQPLEAAAYPLGDWSRRPMPLQICTEKNENNGSLSERVYSTWKTWVFDALAATWGRVPGISFKNVGECSSATSVDMKITLIRGGGSGTCGGGVGDCTVSGMSDASGTDGNVSTIAEADLKRTTVHEVGHGLGLLHEHQMPGRPPLCPFEQSVLDGCTRCINNNPCAAADFNNCFLDSKTSSQTLTADQRNVAQSRINDRTVISNAPVLTTYDPMSIMNYCAGVNGRQAGDYQPTRLDLLGMEMLYPSDRTYPIGCDVNCFYSSDGVIVRSDGAITSDWTARGSVNVTMQWGSIVGRAVAAAALPNGTSTVTYTFKEPRGTSIMRGSGTVSKSDSLHAAIISSVLN